MSKMIQIRHVPDDVHRRLKAQAAGAGMTLTEYLLREVTALAERPTPAELFERIASREPPRGPLDNVAAVRAERNDRS